MGIVDRFTAELEFTRWAEAMRIDLGEDFDADDTKDNEASRRLIIKAITDGRLVIDDTGHAIFTPAGKDPIKFDKDENDLIGAKVGSKRNDDPVVKMYAMLAAWSETSIATFRLMHPADKKVCFALISLFLV